ncbi:MAG: flagellar hook-associated protein FlgK [Nitrospinaceae bacterium]|nr:MAG: flagellar hook-associated protein FlgK [Nitrospinaceae bacterium]
MTANIFSILNTAKLGLLAQQLAMEVTGNNIANVETPGYSRQEVRLTPNIPRNIAVGQLGTGVLVAGIERAHDQFLFEQSVGEGSRTGEFRVRQDIFAQLDILFNENLGRSLNDEFSAFFASLQDLSSNPGGLAERADLLAQAQSLSSVFNHLGSELFQIQRSIDFALVDEVTEINALAGEIAKLNEEIHGSEAGVLVANEQRDRRELLIKQLSEKIDITPLDEMDGQISITLGDGTPLILGEAAFQLSTALNGGNHSFREVLIDQGAAGPKNITAAIQGGTLRGYLDMRDRELAQVIGRLDLLAAGFTREFNRVHQQGFGLDGALASVNQSRAIIGANLRLAENTEFTHAQDIVDQTVQLSNIEDADLVKSAADLARLEQALQATLSSTARILQPTLLDFLR